ncbi:lipase family protein [Leptodesmis sichuanensis]|uniref:lipase family protein n=1 Tax=Leptodesmis sichuanensis TaxID=2906798 RepID=UPI001F349378|nr:lipase family protein [Leptodesmis sichuanensis]UIE36564.1 lipase family protein [Leptodesmis sichuanensis A121]
MPIDYSRAVKYAVFCQKVYENFSTVQFDGITETPILISDPKTDTQCAILPEGTAATIVFRGSESSEDWETDFNTALERAQFDQKVIRELIVGPQEKTYPYAGSSSSGALMHTGFVTAYFAVRDQIHHYIQNSAVSTVVATGHSLGGALATLCAVDIQYNFSDKVTIEAFTYGAPKVGNDGFRDSYNQRVPNSYRVVHGMDIVPELPRWWQGYRAVDKEFRIGQRFSINFITQRFKDHAIDRYIAVLMQLAK